MKIDKLSGVFWKTSPNLFYFSMTLSAVAGVAYAALMPFILYAMENDYKAFVSDPSQVYNFFSSPTAKLALLFAVSVTSIIVFKTLSMLIYTVIGAKAAALMKVNLSEKINALPIIDLERLGQAKLINLLNIDIPRVVGASLAIPNIWVSLVTILGVLAYLLYINTSIFFFVIVCLLIAIITYQLPIMFASKFLHQMRIYEDEVQSGCRGLILGAKELKLDPKKSKNYIDREIAGPEMARKSSFVKGTGLYLLGENYGEVISMIVIGAVVFHLPYIYDIDQMEIFATVMALLYLTGPVGVILSELNVLETGNISLRKLNDVSATTESELLYQGQELGRDWRQIVLKNIGFKYPNAEGAFSVHSVSTTIDKGEITFIVGGNGSGKSTLSKVISTHYLHSEGDICFDEHSITSHDINSVRESIGAIYTDFFLFSRVYKDIDTERANEILANLELGDKVKITDDTFSTTSLSDGQRKRVALMNLLLDDKQIYLFDEWAADQDPQFKEIFYHQILPELRKQDKVVIVISHDDRYFDVADKVIVMDNGSIREVICNDHQDLAETV